MCSSISLRRAGSTSRSMYLDSSRITSLQLISIPASLSRNPHELAETPPAPHEISFLLKSFSGVCVSAWLISLGERLCHQTAALASDDRHAEHNQIHPDGRPSPHV